jgi:BON domain
MDLLVPEREGTDTKARRLPVETPRGISRWELKMTDHWRYERRNWPEYRARYRRQGETGGWADEREDRFNRDRGFGEDPFGRGYAAQSNPGGSGIGLGLAYRAGGSWRREPDDRRGGHYGKGPKGYTRSDERIKEDIHDRLTDDRLVDASNIEVRVRSSEVTLNGLVRSREEKRRAEDVAEQIAGVRHVQNNLRIEKEGER